MSVRSKAASCLELTLFLGGAPLLAVFLQNYPLRRALLLAAALYALLRVRKRVVWRRLFARPAPGWWKGPLWRAGAVCAFILAWVLAVEPHALLNLPRLHFGLWLAFVLLYPALSVLPQELIYRIYLFEAHRELLHRPLAAVTVSALAFAWLHIVFAGWLAPAACLLAGAALALNYLQNRSRPGAIWPLLLEHSLYGQLAFTLGLYQHFFMPR